MSAESFFVLRETRRARQSALAKHNPLRDDLVRLSNREQQVLALVAVGLTNAEIAGRLGISRHTVVTQIASASTKLGATSRRHASTLAARADNG